MGPGRARQQFRNMPRRLGPVKQPRGTNVPWQTNAAGGGDLRGCSLSPKQSQCPRAEVGQRRREEGSDTREGNSRPLGGQRPCSAQARSDLLQHPKNEQSTASNEVLPEEEHWSCWSCPPVPSSTAAPSTCVHTQHEEHRLNPIPLPANQDSLCAGSRANAWAAMEQCTSTDS